ncbi:DBF4-type zinc finger-containing protein 2 [Parambassis ranga]|uniref:DBF4-type zinc finger-containing protein 2 n=1 Tax=Parambassis ranga TaxID=210632 RepID=A0A6P7HWX9_9TELE|nr:DBF4-type zinc finger-containing protein 2 [Parambassis ranga]
MSDSSDEDEQRKTGPDSRMWLESQPGPSRGVPSRQGYCGYCRVLYSNLDQHLSSLRHLDSVRASSRGSSAVSSASSRTKLTLLERFLQDVLQHHPHQYNDPRPSHADLPSVSAPLLPRAELDELRFSDDGSRSQGTREHLPSSDDASCQPANQQRDNGTHSQSGERASQERLSAPTRECEGAILTGHTTHSGVLSPKCQTPPPQSQAPPSVHRKAHRKTNRRKASDTSSSSQPHRAPEPQPHQDLSTGPTCSCQAPTELRPWLSWQKERREVQKEEAFSSDHSDPLDQTIEEVIQRCCHGVTACEREEAESFHLSLPVSMETQSEDWDSPVQVVLHQGHTSKDTPVQASQCQGQDVSHLMDFQVDLEDQVYSSQLDSALHSERRPGGGAGENQGFWTLPVEEILPAPEHMPESFRGKTWAQIEQEDEQRVEKLVRQFRGGRFVCYFDSESLARYGRRRRNKKYDQAEEAEPGVLPLVDRDDEESACLERRKRRRKRRVFRVASRCQVVKVSHSTQTVQLVVPAVHQQALEAPPTSVPLANHDTAERTPEAQMWRCLPPPYTSIVTPVQPRTSLVYLLCSPSGPTPAPAAGSASKRCRKKRRPLDLQGLKVKYKRLPVRFYEPGTNRILKNQPKGFLWRRGPPPLDPPPPCVRQLFRSLSPDLNTDRLPGEGPAGSSSVKGQRSADPTFSHSSSFLLSTLSTDSTQTHLTRRRVRMPRTLTTTLSTRSGRRERTIPPPSTRRTRAQAAPTQITASQPRREGLRQSGPSRKLPGSTDPAPLSSTPTNAPSPRRGRGRRGRGTERGHR